MQVMDGGDEVALTALGPRFDVVLVETVGVGQSEVSVANMTDMFVLLMLPGGGDELQGIKRGITELVDVIVINKADGANLEAAEAARGEYNIAQRLLHGSRVVWFVNGVLLDDPLV